LVERKGRIVTGSGMEKLKQDQGWVERKGRIET